MLMVELIAGPCFSGSVFIFGAGLSFRSLFVTTGTSEVLSAGVIEAETDAGTAPDPEADGAPLLTRNPSFSAFS